MFMARDNGERAVVPLSCSFFYLEGEIDNKQGNKVSINYDKKPTGSKRDSKIEDNGVVGIIADKMGSDGPSLELIFMSKL